MIISASNIRYENPRELGSDRIANAVAALALYGGPCIFIDFGTATTYGVLSDRNEFLGGAIGPGLRMMNRALSTGTAKLPSIELTLPELEKYAAPAGWIDVCKIRE